VPNGIIVSERFFVIFSKVTPFKALFLVFSDFFDQPLLKKACFIDVLNRIFELCGYKSYIYKVYQ
jgi:hypothetical protein